MSRTEQPTTVPSQPARPVKAFSQPLMWLVVGIPAATVVAGLFTLWIAVHGADTPVGSDYVKQGLSVTPDTRREDRARELGVAGTLAMHTTPGNMLLVELTLAPNGADIKPTRLRLLHPSDPNNDLAIHMLPAGDGHWHARQPITWAPGTRWHIALEGEDWRLPIAGLQTLESLRAQPFDANKATAPVLQAPRTLPADFRPKQ